MDWTELKIIIDSKYTEVASDIANMVVPYGIYIEDYTDLEEAAMNIAHIDLIDEELVAKDRSKSIIHIYINSEENALESVSYLKERLTAEGIEHSIEFASVKESDWADNWKQYFKPLEIGDRLAVCPSWEKYNNADNRKVLQIDPGAAFGTGAHDTTRLCLSVLDKVCCDNKSILDIGCGSGILAISALLLGCGAATGVDIDPLAVKVAKANAELNSLADKCSFICGDLVDKISGKFDIVCANIVADVIIKLCDSVLQFMNDDSIFVCSGIIDTRESDVLAKLESVGLRVVERYTSLGWVALVCRKD